MTRWLRDGETLASASVAAGQLTRTGHNIEQRKGMGMGGVGGQKTIAKGILGPKALPTRNKSTIHI